MRIKAKSIFVYAIMVTMMAILCCCDISNDELMEVNQVDISSDSGNIEFFGFALVNTYVDDITDKVAVTDYTEEIKEFTNIVDILVIEANQDIRPTIEYNNQLGLMTLVHCFELFYEQEESDMYVLRNDYKERYQVFYEINELSLNPVILYIGEEPLHNGVTNEDIAYVSDYIKSVDTNIKTMVIEAAPTVQSMQLIPTVDYVGFDQYFQLNPTDNQEFMDNLKYLEENIFEHQKIVLIMDTHYIEKYHKEFGNLELEQMGQVANNYYNLARNHEDIVGLIGYCWPSGFDDTSAIGARNMPSEIKLIYESIGRNIIKNN